MLVILAMVVFFLRGRLSFLSEGIAEVRKADGWGVTLALCASLASLAAMAEVMRILLRAGKVRTRRRDVNALVLSANAWSTSFPAGKRWRLFCNFRPCGGGVPAPFCVPGTSSCPGRWLRCGWQRWV